MGFGFEDFDLKRSAFSSEGPSSVMRMFGELNVLISTSSALHNTSSSNFKNIFRP